MRPILHRPHRSSGNTLTPVTRAWLDQLTAAWMETDLPVTALISAFMAVVTEIYGRDTALVNRIWADRETYYPSSSL